MSKPHQDQPVTVTLRQFGSRYTSYLHIPAEWIRELGLKLNREVVIDKSVNPRNPMAWELKITPVLKKKKEVKRGIDPKSPLAY